MKKVTLIGLFLFLAGVSFADEPITVSHWDFQAMYSDGSSSFDDDGPWQVSLEGILLNSPEKWLDPTADPTVGEWLMGGEWEIFVQGEGADHAGTACWMGQNYDNGPGDDNYTNAEWLTEIRRLNRDPETEYVFRAGDRIRITGTYLFYAGKLNINENHQTDPVFDFKIELVKPAVGLPQPEEIKVSDLKNPDNSEIFDATRMSGGEYYQSRLVRLEDVNVVDSENWGSESTITVRDANGLTFPIYLAIGEGFSRYSCPAGQVDLIGIMDQKGTGFPPNPKVGYRLLVMDYDGNGLVVGDLSQPRGNLPGDVNNDYIVDYKDLAELANNWLQVRDGLYH